MTQDYFDNDQMILRTASDISASVADAGTGGDQYESWRFEAVSDDGDKVISIVFLEDLFNAGTAELSDGDRLPAIVFTYYRGGSAVYRTLAEFAADEFVAETEKPGCSIGESFFTFRDAEYGSGIYVELRLSLPGGEFIEAVFEWLFIESDLRMSRDDAVPARRNLWNMVSPRSDVSGKFTVTGESGGIVETTSFRGTGIYEHFRGQKHLFGGIECWLMGTSHFNDSTVVFTHLEHSGSPDDNRLIVIRDGVIEELAAEYEERSHGRTNFGMRYPGIAKFAADGISLTVESSKVIVSNVFVVRFLSEVTLRTDADSQTVFCVTEILSPKVKYTKWLSWLITRRGWEVN